MTAHLSVLVFALILVCTSAPAKAGTYSWGAIAAPSRIAGTELTGNVTVQTLAGTNGAVQQLYVPADGLLHTRTLAVGKQSGSTPPAGTAVSGGLGRLLEISGTPAVGPSFHGTETIHGGTVYFSGRACTDDWTCRYGVYMRACKDAGCSQYLLPAETVGFPYSATKDGWSQNVAASADGWVFLLRGQKDAGTGSNQFFQIWARNAWDGSRAVRLAANSAAGILLSGNLELVPGVGGQLTIVFPDIGRAALYVPGKGWKALP